MIFPWLSEEKIDGAADELLRRAFCGALDRSSPLDLDALVYDYLCESEQLSFDDDADLGYQNDELILGKTRPISGQILLASILKADSDPGRSRFTLAHEIGHWVLHRPFVLARAQEPDLFGNSGQEFEFVGLNRGIFPDGARGPVSREEWQANRFATALLIDPHVLRSEFVARFGAPPVARRSPGWRLRTTTLREHARLLASCDTDSHSPLRSVFGLSAEAMAIALEAHGYATEQPPMI